MSLSQAWYKRAWWLALLLPLSWLFRCAAAIRKWRLTTWQCPSPLPVIVVGNITVGGTGKTPLVAYLVDALKELGYQPAIVSRGFGGSTQYPHLVQQHDQPSAVGDEIAMLYQQVHCPIVVDPNRARAVNFLKSLGQCDIVVSDDGLQHYAMARSIEIAVIDGARRLGNGWCLPAGPLREPAKRLKSVDFVVVNGQAYATEYAMRLKSAGFFNVKDRKSVSALDFENKTVHAVAGIGNPDRFFDTLTQMGIRVIKHPFPDHHVFKASDLNFGDKLPVVMTEKDAVKCQAFAPTQCYYLAVRAVLPNSFTAALQRRLYQLL